MRIARRMLLTGLAMVIAGLPLAGSPSFASPARPGNVVGAAAGSCAAPTQTPEFEEAIIDTERAGGEPIVTTLDDGTLLWGSHAGTTHFYTPGAPDPDTESFLRNYNGQTYYYFSEDDGKTWEYVERPPIPNEDLATLQGVPASGFSDPEFAVDAAGQVYISEINLANVAVSKSVDGGRTYGVANPLAFTITDRQWMAADAKDVLYMTGNGFAGGSFPRNAVGNVGHFLAKSTDGGVTWSEAITSNPNGVADIQVEPKTGTLYEISANPDGTFGMAAFRNIRGENGPAAADFSEPEITTIAEGVGYAGVQRLIDPSFDMDSEGNLYVVWTENGQGDAGRPFGIYYSYSTDGNKTWADPIRIDPDTDTDIWPWIAVGDPGKVAIVYLAVDRQLEDDNAELATDDDGWNVFLAHTQTGLGCDAGGTPGFDIVQASAKPVHFGTICMGGTVCQAELVDRRLGDYFANEIDGNGRTYISVSNTAVEEAGGAVALPMVIRQVSGPTFAEPDPDKDPDGGVDPDDDGRDPDDGSGTGPDDDARDPVLPATGGGITVGLGLLLMASGAVLRRRTRTPN